MFSSSTTSNTACWTSVGMSYTGPIMSATLDDFLFSPANSSSLISIGTPLTSNLFTTTSFDLISNNFYEAWSCFFLAVHVASQVGVSLNCSISCTVDSSDIGCSVVSSVVSSFIVTFLSSSLFRSSPEMTLITNYLLTGLFCLSVTRTTKG